MSRKTAALRLMDLADQKGFDVARSTIRDHWRLIDGKGEAARKPGTKSAAFSVREATHFLEAKPDQNVQQH
jgi:hypothetical protein